MTKIAKTLVAVHTHTHTGILKTKKINSKERRKFKNSFFLFMKEVI